MSVSEASAAPNSEVSAEFERWANVFMAYKAFSHPSELHGVLCGCFAAGGRMQEKECAAVVCEHIGLAPAALEESPELAVFAAGIYRHALAQLRSMDMSFQPLLPDDDYAIEQRLEALIAWVRGFLAGMALAAGESLGEAPEEIRELMEDMVAISQLSDEEDASEENDQQLVQVTEYVRLGALAVFTEFNEPEQTPGKASTLH